MMPTKTGDIYTLVGKSYVAKPIEDIEGGPLLPDGTRPSHVAMVVTLPGHPRYVYEMTWPRLIRTEESVWLKSQGCTIWLSRKTVPFTLAQELAVGAWWEKRLGLWYDVPELLGLGIHEPWARVCVWLHLPSWFHPAPLMGNGVCSVNVGLAFIAGGCLISDVRTLSPSEATALPFMAQPPELVSVAMSRFIRLKQWADDRWAGRPLLTTGLALAKPRDPRWRVWRKIHLLQEPVCQWCGGVLDLQVHHIEPFHINPAREGDQTNLITLCERPGRDCHWQHGHNGRSWGDWNSNVRADCACHKKEQAA